MPDVVPLKFAHDIDLHSPLNPLYIIWRGGRTLINVVKNSQVQMPNTNNDKYNKKNYWRTPPPPPEWKGIIFLRFSNGIMSGILGRNMLASSHLFWGGGGAASVNDSIRVVYKFAIVTKVTNFWSGHVFNSKYFYTSKCAVGNFGHQSHLFLGGEGGLVTIPLVL